MLDVVLYQPEIPPNTGNIIRLCANTGAALHLIKPLGFDLSDRELKRAGLDYHEFASIQVHNDYSDCRRSLAPKPFYLFSTRGKKEIGRVRFEFPCAMVFGPETRGLPRDMLDACDPDQVVRLPMVAGSRSLNLSNAVAVAVYECWRQQGFSGAVQT